MRLTKESLLTSLLRLSGFRLSLSLQKDKPYRKGAVQREGIEVRS